MTDKGAAALAVPVADALVLPERLKTPRSLKRVGCRATRPGRCQHRAWWGPNIHHRNGNVTIGVIRQGEASNDRPT